MPSRVALVMAFVVIGCAIPRDPEGTYERVQGGTMRAGLTENEPWTRLVEGQPAGIEVDLLVGFAEQLDAEIDWTQGSEAELLERLHQGELDVVAAGLKKSTPWAKQVGLTRPYITVRGGDHVLAVRSGENRWLMELELFLEAHRQAIRDRYRAEAAQ